MPPIDPAWRRLGPIRPELARRHALPEGIGVLCGIHDSSANFYRYQQAGLSDHRADLDRHLDRRARRYPPPGRLSSSPNSGSATPTSIGRPLAGVLAMGGREFATLAGDAATARPTLRDVAAHHRRRDDGPALFQRSRRAVSRHRRQGAHRRAAPALAGERRALALLYVALLTDACLDVLGENGTTVLDGSFVKDPLLPGAGRGAATEAADAVQHRRQRHRVGRGAAGRATRRAPSRRRSTCGRRWTIDLPGLADTQRAGAAQRSRPPPRQPRTNDNDRDGDAAPCAPTWSTICRRMNSTGINQGTAGQPVAAHTATPS